MVRPRRAAPAEAARVTRAEVNLAHVRHNYRELVACLGADAKQATRPAAAVWGVLKADGYGHGAAAIATALQNAGIEGLCVALLEEGIELRNAGLRCPILVMGGYWGRHRDGIENLIEHDLTPVVYDAGQVQRLAATTQYMARGPLGVHLKIDTGMGRLGARADALNPVVDELSRQRLLRVDGLMTHLACADSDSDATEAQMRLFDHASAEVRARGLSPQLRHAANSAAMLRMPGAQLDIVRPGIALFGVHPCPGANSDAARRPKLRPAMRVLSEVVALRDVPAGEAIGYGHRWRAARPSRIATIPMGYADGLSRALSGRGAVLIGGKRAPIVGAVSMDLTMVDVTDHPAVAVRDEVVVLGSQRGRLGSDCISAEEIGELCGTIAWEILTSISRRVPRYYRHP